MRSPRRNSFRWRRQIYNAQNMIAAQMAARIGMSRATLRVLGYVASTLLLGVGFLMIAFGGTALHDRIAGTRVVRRGTVG